MMKLTIGPRSFSNKIQRMEHEYKVVLFHPLKKLANATH
jgi:hypothetical protein